MSSGSSKRIKLTRREALKLGGTAVCALCLSGTPVCARTDNEQQEAENRDEWAQSPTKGLIGARRSPFFSALDNGAVRCTLCPNECKVQQGERGNCRVRENRGGALYTLVHGNPALLQLDPIERKPFFHVLPGSRSLSVATAGCNIACKFCQVWDMALVSPEEVFAYDFPPKRVISQTRDTQAQSVAFTLGEPVVYFEYMHDIAKLAKKHDLLNLLHSNGYINPDPLRELCPLIDAANIDLKSFDPKFYERVCDGKLEPVKRTLKLLKSEGVHIEITNILIPTLNDDMDKIREMCTWIRDEIGASTPLHFTRFYPLYKLANLPPTPVSTLDEARSVARDVGLEHVYVANVAGHEGANTFCPKCEEKIVHRVGFMIESMDIDDGKCGSCSHPIEGVWESS